QSVCASVIFTPSLHDALPICGGLNFDAKVRRGSFEPEDLFRAHIAGMDSFAVGLKVAQKLLDDKVLENVIEDRYSSFTEGIGKDIVSGKADFHQLEKHA